MNKINPLFARIFWIFFCFISVTFHVQGQQNDFMSDLFQEQPEFLPVDQAFQFDFYQKDDQLTLSWQIAEGYYLYKKQFKTVVKQAELGEPVFPEAREIEDEFFGVSDVFFEHVDVQFPIKHSINDGVVKIQYQGCAELGLCYPPTTKVVYLSEVVAKATDSGNHATEPSSVISIKEQESSSAPVSEQFQLLDLLKSQDSMFLTLLGFLLLGIGLAFTPCVFPMYPIISGIVVGQGKNANTSHTLSLSLIYVQGMALTYSLLGLVVASAGVQFQAALQHPAILTVLIVVFVALAAAMFGAYELQLPSSWQVKLNNLSNQQKGGSYFGVFVMGAISGLVASPCTTAPLTAILLYIAQSGDLMLGFTALYVLSFGMGIPLVAFAVTGGKLLPKAGNWMNVVKVTFGFMMLAVALVFVERMYSGFWISMVWGVLGLAMFGYYYEKNQQTVLTFWKGVRTVVIFLGMFASAIYGYEKIRDSLMPETAQQVGTEMAHLQFKIVKNYADFEQKVAQANAQGKSVMIDLYADWCVACKEFEKYTFPDPRVKAVLANTELFQIDLTDNTPENLEFQEAFSVLGLPTIMFFDVNGTELERARVTGFMPADRFAEHINRALK
ncbi:protein-disulfide reductase DsbD [Paraneptunicella aestuarii]|uniref:protein-disulfide reductase DsbD n=1 Tax=Paraneptunicella aestuarii TaxID=2831148 RepID=UPI001E62A882|nr:protein-disulfide reductase DsbD [Paraneptunicella aestuarii]UAA38342.1 protein-disulfide reductase DsbD [Paraneptunicella aestuarii]